MRQDPPALAESVPEVLRRVLLKALQRDPAKRYPSALAMRTDLREAERMLWLEEREARVDPARRIRHHRAFCDFELQRFRGKGEFTQQLSNVFDQIRL